jgi:hypothetical protein
LEITGSQSDSRRLFAPGMLIIRVQRKCGLAPILALWLNARVYPIKWLDHLELDGRGSDDSAGC